MEPITLIMTALATGLAAGVSAVATETVTDTYRGLKVLIQRKFVGKPEAEIALAKYEEKPQVWEAPLRDALAETDADKDEEIIQAAQQLMSLLDPEQAAMGRYNVQITGTVQGFVQGDHAEVIMYFGESSDEKE
jgi:hypothetical protein